MKSKTLHLLFAALWLLALSAMAGPRTLQQAKAIAEKHAAAVGMPVPHDGMAPKATKARKMAAPGTAHAQYDSYYVFDNGDGKGFTIVSGDDRMPEIVGYATQGSYDETALPDGYTYFIQAYESLVQQVADGDEHALRTVREAEALRASGIYMPNVEPLLGNIQWGQGSPYNLNTPTLAEYQGMEEKCATGCVATAMAQIMMYHRWPDVLKADIPAYVTKTRHYNIAGETAGRKIDWDNMLEQYTGHCTRNQTVAVANLMSLCGKAVEMDYDKESGAALRSTHMQKYFGYDKETVQTLSRSWFTLEKWISLLNGELEAARPVFYCGQSSTGGHAFVCDGVNSQGFYHINWGWGGYQDGYYDLTLLNPGGGNGVGQGAASNGYNMDSGMIIGLQKDNGTIDTPAAQWPDVAMAKWDDKQYVKIETQRPFAGIAVNCDINMVFANISGHNLKNAMLTFGIKNEQGGYTPLTKEMNMFDIQGADGATYGIICNRVFSYAFPVGRTTIYGIYSTDAGKTWQRCQHDYDPIVVEATANEIKVLPTPLSATLTANKLYGGQTCTYFLKVTNDSDVEYGDLLHVFYNTTDKFDPMYEIANYYSSVPAHSTITKMLDLPTNEGVFYLWVKTDPKHGDTFIVDAQRFEGKKAPQLTLVSVESNATPGVNETENAYYGEYKVAVPRVDDDKLVLKYKVRNDGGDFDGTVRITLQSGGSDEGIYANTYDMTFKGDGTVNEFEKSIDCSVFKNRLIVSEFSVDDIATALTEEEHWYYLVDMQGYGFQVPMYTNWFYVTGTPAGISEPEDNAQTADGTTISVGKGCIAITSATDRRINVYSPQGQAVATANVHGGMQTSIQLPRGIYVVCGKKVAVR